MSDEESTAPLSARNQLGNSPDYSKLLLESVLNTVGEAIITIDKAGFIIMANQAAADMWGYPVDELEGMGLIKLIPEKYRDAHKTGMERYLAGGDPSVLNRRIELEGLHASNKLFPIELLIRENDFGQEKIFTAALRDVTNRRKKQDLLLHNHRLEVVEQLSGGIAHDFNNLLSVIKGNLYFIQQSIGNESSDVSSFLDDALSATQDSADLTARLLTFSRSEFLDSAVIELSSLLKKTVHFLSSTVYSRLSLRSELDTANCYINVDSIQLENALVNLVLNARDAMPDGGTVIVTVARHKQGNSQRPDSEFDERRLNAGDYIKLSVSDTGKGIGSDQLSRIFEPFYSTKNVGKGSGLGLSMVYGFTKHSGGKCAVDSQPGVGTTVSMYFPEAKSPEDLADNSHNGHVLSFLSKTILVVEGDPRVRRVALRDLRNLGYNVLEAESSDTAQEIIGSRERVDMLYCDVHMRGAFGVKQLIAWIEKNHPHINIIFASGSTTDVEEIMEGSVAYSVVTKPYTIETLSDKIITSFSEKY